MEPKKSCDRVSKMIGMNTEELKMSDCSQQCLIQSFPSNVTKTTLNPKALDLKYLVEMVQYQIITMLDLPTTIILSSLSNKFSKLIPIIVQCCLRTWFVRDMKVREAIFDKSELNNMIIGFSNCI